MWWNVIGVEKYSFTSFIGAKVAFKSAVCLKVHRSFAHIYLLDYNSIVSPFFFKDAETRI